MLPTATCVTQTVADPADKITLDETARHRRRMAMRSDGGIEFLLDLPEARLLQHGEGLVLDDGRVIEVHAAPEPLYEVRGRDARHLVTLAWQLGNRHLPAEIAEDRIFIRRDHVIHEMLIGLGATVGEIMAPFSPERGAYHGHHHGGGGDHEHGA
ncbi:urease accessory protein UreE [Chelativorans sp. M5D2P16]|uniref:urease accessory protein UreE n=1 Tax=Chelativorans sp. M5D2P16 TaxID=3095678 RepID=UPI002ACA3EC3|nr:urease accessory protein UreE [Chelativorans sp. M5D2P16]MDZ5699721.1 urease accessory protein UreE [Chelativorans sp. M5D2P16]